MAKGEKKKKSLVSKIITIVVAILLIIIILASSFFSIIDSIIELIKAIIREFIRAIINFLKNPIGWLQDKWATFKNWLGTSIGADVEFDAAAYEDERKDPKIVIKQSDFENMKKSLDTAINRKVAGLDNIMLKKMLLAYYRGIYLDDTEIMIELTKEDLNLNEEEWMSYFKVFKEKENLLEDITTGALLGAAAGAMVGSGPGAILGAITGAVVGGITSEEHIRVLLDDAGKQRINSDYESEICPFEIIGGDTKEGRGEDGFIYLKTKGMVQIYDACGNCEENGDIKNCVSCRKILYYPEDVLDEMYNNHYLKTLLNNESYANSVLDHLNKCYSYTINHGGAGYVNDITDAIKMYTIRQTQTETPQATWEYVNETKYDSEVDDPIEWVQSLFGVDKFESRVRNLQSKELYPVSAQTIEYSSKVAQYATPVEFMVDLLELVGSKDFVNAFIETVGEGNYIKLKLYRTDNTTITNMTENKVRKTVVSGERTYSAYITEYKPKGSSTWTAGNAGATVDVTRTTNNGRTETVNIRLDNYKDGYDYKIAFEVNGTLYDTYEMGYETNSFLWFDDNKLVKKISCEVYDENRWTDTSKVVENKTSTFIEVKNDVGITEVKTWYATINSKNLVNKTITAENLQGDQYNNRKVEILRYEVNGKDEFDFWELFAEMAEMQQKIQTINYSDPPDEYFSPDINPEIFKQQELSVIEDTYKERNNNQEKVEEYNPNLSVYTMDECLNVQFNYTLQKGTQAYNNTGWFEDTITYKDYTITGMTHSDSSVTKLTMYSNYLEELSEGLAEGRVVVNYHPTRPFLGLLSNETGTYVRGAAFKPQSNAANAGKLVTYKDIGGIDIKVGPLLENGAEMLYALLEESERTQPLVEVMKYIMNDYVNNNYSVTDFNFYIFENETKSFINVQ